MLGQPPILPPHLPVPCHLTQPGASAVDPSMGPLVPPPETLSRCPDSPGGRQPFPPLSCPRLSPPAFRVDFQVLVLHPGSLDPMPALQSTPSHHVISAPPHRKQEVGAESRSHLTPSPTGPPMPQFPLSWYLTWSVLPKSCGPLGTLGPASLSCPCPGTTCSGPLRGSSGRVLEPPGQELPATWP